VGVDCGRLSLPCPENCSGHGVCDGERGKCDCDPSWGGVACVDPALPCPNECCDHGDCDTRTGACACEVDWAGIDCCKRVSPCPVAVPPVERDGSPGAAAVPETAAGSSAAGLVCSGADHGMCDLETGECRCRRAWHGDVCGLPKCGAHGEMVEDGSCRCDHNWYSPLPGSVCDEDGLELCGCSVFCLADKSAHDSCNKRAIGCSHAGQCLCASRFGGKTCDIPLEPTGELNQRNFPDQWSKSSFPDAGLRLLKAMFINFIESTADFVRETAMFPQVSTVLAGCGRSTMPPEEVEKTASVIVDRADFGGARNVSFNEFLVAARRDDRPFSALYDNVCKYAFARLDRDASGAVSLREVVMAVLTRMKLLPEPPCLPKRPEAALAEDDLIDVARVSDGPRCAFVHNSTYVTCADGFLINRLWGQYRKEGDNTLRPERRSFWHDDERDMERGDAVRVGLEMRLVREQVNATTVRLRRAYAGPTYNDGMYLYKLRFKAGSPSHQTQRSYAKSDPAKEDCAKTKEGCAPETGEAALLIDAADLAAGRASLTPEGAAQLNALTPYSPVPDDEDVKAAWDEAHPWWSKVDKDFDQVWRPEEFCREARGLPTALVLLSPRVGLIRYSDPYSDRWCEAIHDAPEPAPPGICRVGADQTDEGAQKAAIEAAENGGKWPGGGGGGGAGGGAGGGGRSAGGVKPRLRPRNSGSWTERVRRPPPGRGADTFTGGAAPLGPPEGAPLPGFPIYLPDKWSWCDMSNPFLNPFCPTPNPWFNILIKFMIPAAIRPVIGRVKGKIANGKAFIIALVMCAFPPPTNMFLETSSEARRSEEDGEAARRTSTRSAPGAGAARGIWNSGPGEEAVSLAELHALALDRELSAWTDARDHFAAHPEAAREYAERAIGGNSKFGASTNSRAARRGGARGLLMTGGGGDEDPFADQVKKIYELMVPKMTDELFALLARDISTALESSLHPRLAFGLRDSLERSLAHGLLHVVGNSVGLAVSHTVPALLTKLLPRHLFLIVDTALTHTLTRSLTHTISSSVVATVGEDPAQDEHCFNCLHYKRECQLCTRATRAEMYYKQYYTHYYAAYFSDYFADMAVLTRAGTGNAKNMLGRDGERVPKNPSETKSSPDRPDAWAKAKT
jgi:hypothetical protein